MLAYLKLFRWQNLLILILIQGLFRYCVVKPLLLMFDYDLALSDIDFGILVLATVITSAAGYAINDYFDIKTDRINKPHKIILGKALSRRAAISSHIVLNIIAILLGFYLSYKVGNWSLSFIFIAIIIILWLYSIRYKRKYFIGNFMISILAAFVIAIVWIFEYNALANFSEVPINVNVLVVDDFVKIFALFAFLTTLLREIIKDIEDIKGDAKTGCRTIPIVSGVRTCKNLLIFLAIVIIAFTGYFQLVMLDFELFGSQYQFNLLFAYVLLTVQIPLILLINKVHIAKEKTDYQVLSRLAKFIMITGIFSMFLLYFYLT
ncbi:MAG: geranylgeranylglycerol-phosphate geranylgeranyltransferase [Bacteroidetes bacterium]|nr:geranylgeranylglycerol-phosphate geranylgeranyltransferase [Bacteroidota bacterium]